jgi:PAS domain S-box-containing protein
MGIKGTILIVDDSIGDSRILSPLFRSKGFEVDFAHNAFGALTKAKKRFFDLVLVDIRLPDIDGLALLRALKGIKQNIAIVMISACASIEMAVHAIKEGAEGYLIKPRNIDEVITTVEECFEKRKLAKKNRQLMLTLRQELAERRAAKESLYREHNVDEELTRLYRLAVSPGSAVEMITDVILAQAKGLTQSAHGWISSIDPCETSLGHAAHTLKPFFTNSPPLHSVLKGLPGQRISTNNFLSVPALLGGEPVSQIVLANSERDYTERDLSLVKRMAEYYSLAIQRIRFETALKEAETRFNVTAEQSKAAIAIVQDGLIQYSNQAFSEIVERPLPELLMLGIDEMLGRIYPEDRASVEGLHRLLQAGNISVQTNRPCRLMMPNGRVKWIELQSRAIPYNKGSAFMVTITNITDRKASEEREKRLQFQLMEADKLASLGVLVAGVAHEINNPNHSIMSNAYLVSEIWASVGSILEAYHRENGDFLVGGMSYVEMRETIPKFLQGITDGAKRIDRIVGDLKRFSRKEAFEPTAEIDLNRVVESAISLSKSFIYRGTRNFQMALADDLPPIAGSFQRLEQVVVNLLQNACQALCDKEQGIFLRTSYKRDARQLIITVRDEGDGIPARSLKRVKDPFFTTKSKAGGTGLGLSISTKIVEDHCGTLNIESEPGVGTTVRVMLPVSRNGEGEETSVSLKCARVNAGGT